MAGRKQQPPHHPQRPVIWLRPYRNATGQTTFGPHLGPYQAIRTRQGALDVQTSDGEWATLFYMTVANTWAATALLTDPAYARHWAGVLIESEEPEWPKQT